MGSIVTQNSRKHTGQWSIAFENHGFRTVLTKLQVSVLATFCAFVTLNPRFRHPDLRPYRAGMYAGLGLSALVFTSHGILLYGWEAQNNRMSLDWMAMMALLNLMGATIYSARVDFLRLRFCLGY